MHGLAAFEEFVIRMSLQLSAAQRCQMHVHVGCRLSASASSWIGAIKICLTIRHAAITRGLLNRIALVQ
jgi:hypothetical protein